MERYTFVTRPDTISGEIEKRIDAELQNTEGFVRDDQNPDTVLVIGGDGTFIYAVHQYLDRLADVKFHGIHTGTLGFYTDFMDSEVNEFLDVYKKSSYTTSTYPMLVAEDNRGKRSYAINEIRVENAARTQVLDVYLNGEYFETFRGTGMCVCTQLGSTAYNKSLGGAVMQEGLDLIQMSEISGIHHSKFRSLIAPFVLKGDTVIEFVSNSFSGALLGFDSEVYPMSDVTSLTIKICSARNVRVIRGKNVSYFKRLKSLF